MFVVAFALHEIRRKVWKTVLTILSFLDVIPFRWYFLQCAEMGNLFCRRWLLKLLFQWEASLSAKF